MPLYSVTARDVQRLLVCRSHLKGTPHVIRASMPYRVLERKGAGGFGQVFSAINEFTGEMVAVKVGVWNQDDYENKEEVPISIVNETRILNRVKHPNVIHGLGIYDRRDYNAMIIVMPLAEGGDLYDYLCKDQAPLPEQQCLSFTRQLLRGLNYLHTTMGLVHRDLKAPNILLDGTHQNLKISDFGTSVPAYGPHSDRLCRDICTIFVRPPEYMMASDGEEEHDPFKVDIWSLGCVVFHMTFKKYAFLFVNRDSSGAIRWESNSEIGTLIAIFKKLGTPSEATWPGISRLANYQPCFPKFPHKRIEDSCDFTGVPRKIVDVIGSTLRLHPWHRLKAEDLLRDFTQEIPPVEPADARAGEQADRNTRQRVGA